MLTKERKGEIAYLLLKHRVKKDEIHLGNPGELRREIGNLSKATGIPPAELQEFAETMIRELVDETFER